MIRDKAETNKTRYDMMQGIEFYNNKRMLKMLSTKQADKIEESKNQKERGTESNNN